MTWAADTTHSHQGYLLPVVTGEFSYTLEYDIPKNFTVQSRKMGGIRSSTQTPNPATGGGLTIKTPRQ
jgi:hypothetical protein